MNTDVVSLGNSGIFIDKTQLLLGLKDWLEKTPPEVKQKQIETIAAIGAFVCIGSLFILALADN